jgi:hypothetical protein
MVEPLRHRQTKGAATATDMFYLTPPRHISTLPNPALTTPETGLPVYLDKRISSDRPGMPQTGHERKSLQHHRRHCAQSAMGTSHFRFEHPSPGRTTTSVAPVEITALRT